MIILMHFANLMWIGAGTLQTIIILVLLFSKNNLYMWNIDILKEAEYSFDVMHFEFALVYQFVSLKESTNNGVRIFKVKHTQWKRCLN